MDERRDYDRHSIPMMATASYLVAGKLTQRRVDLFNLSKGGACLNHSETIAEGTAVDLEISDCTSGFVDQLGIWNKVHGDMVDLHVHGRVLRSENSGNFDHKHVAVQFNGPIKIMGY
jgi:hypothetical protein